MNIPDKGIHISDDDDDDDDHQMMMIISILTLT
jgi:hypothetical protein